jgi:hypothetical protein
MSAAKSHRVVSVSCPTAEMVGICGRGERAHHLFLVKGPQILDRAAAARDDEKVGPARHGVEAAHRRRDLGRGSLPLHRHRPDDDVGRAAIGEAVEDVANDGAGGRGDDADRARQERQPALALLIEQPLRGELAAALVEQRHQRALPGQLQPIDDDLIFGAARIGGELAGRDDFDAVLRPEAEHLRATLPDHRVHAGLVVLQREVAMAGAVALEAADLAAHADMAERVLDGALQRQRQFGHALGGRIVAPDLGR